MKQLNSFTALLLSLFFLSCNSGAQSEAGQTAAAIKETMTANSPSDASTSESGVYMKATIDGKSWEAAKMTPDNDPGSSYKRIHGEKGDISISFQLSKPYTGMKRTFSEDFAADLWYGDDVFGGRKGEVVVTKADDKWIEGTFHFTATTVSSNKSHEVTNGSFRIAATHAANQ